MPALSARRARRRARPERSGSWDARQVDHRGRAARRRLWRSADLDADLRRRRSRGAALAGARWRRARPATASTTRCCSARSAAWSCSSRRRTWSRCSSASSCCRSRSTCCARPSCAASTSLEAGLKYLVIGSVGSATLLYGLALHLRRDRLDRLRGDRRRAQHGQHRSTDPLLLTGIALVARRPGLQGLGRAVPPVDARRLRGRADAGHRVHGRRDQGGGVRRLPALLRRGARSAPARLGPALAVLATITIVVGNVGALGQSLAQADARLVVRRAGGLHARRRRRRHAARRRRRRSSTSPSTW